MKDSGIEWLGEISKHWDVKKLKYVTKKVLTGKTPPSGNEKYYYGDINWFTPGDFDDTLFLNESKGKISDLAISEAGLTHVAGDDAKKSARLSSNVRCF